MNQLHNLTRISASILRSSTFRTIRSHPHTYKLSREKANSKNPTGLGGKSERRMVEDDGYTKVWYAKSSIRWAGGGLSLTALILFGVAWGTEYAPLGYALDLWWLVVLAVRITYFAYRHFCSFITLAFTYNRESYTASHLRDWQLVMDATDLECEIASYFLPGQCFWSRYSFPGAEGCRRSSCMAAIARSLCWHGPRCSRGDVLECLVSIPRFCAGRHGADLAASGVVS